MSHSPNRAPQQSPANRYRDTLLGGTTCALEPAPLGAAPDNVHVWFDSAVETSEPVNGNLVSQRDVPDSNRRMAKADHTRLAYGAAVRAWCARHALLPLPASAQDVAAFLAGEQGRKLSPETIKLRQAAIRYLRRWPPGADRRRLRLRDPGRYPPGAAKKGQIPLEKVAATVTFCAGCWRRSRTICAACGTGRCCWSASPERCGARSWRRSVSCSWRRPTAGSGLPCRKPKASRPTR